MAEKQVATAEDLRPPIAETRDSRTTHHNIEINDEYAWLRADNWQDVMRDPEKLPAGIRTYLEEENSYTADRLQDTEDLQKTLFSEMKARIKEDDSSVPAPDGAYAYYWQFVTGGQYRQICRRPRGGGEPVVLLDGNAEADGKDYWQLGGTSHSPDHSHLAFCVDDKGSELYSVRVRDLSNGKDLDDIVTDTSGYAVWGRDARSFYYVRLDSNHRPLSVHRHIVGTAHSDDVCLYEEADTGFYVSVSKTQSGRFLVIATQDHQTSELRLLDLDDECGTLRLVAARRKGHEYDLEHQGERFIITTNSGGAEDFRVCEAPVAAPEEENWGEVVAHKQGRLILHVAAFKTHLARLEREDGNPRIVITDCALGEDHTIAFDESAYSLGLDAGYEYDTTQVRFSYSSMTTPTEVYEYDMATRTRVLRKRQEVPSGHDTARYVTKRLFAKSHDGEQVPISVLYLKDTPLDGSAPLLLYGYGSYGISMPASFSTARLSLVDRGFVYAIAHIRGGKDKGYRWYTDGKLEKKQNTFSDFIAAGEYLAAKNYTSRGRIIGHGGSAGGMLMGAVANQAPDLFCGIIADVPFVDVLNTMLDADLPLTPPEWQEWGNPIKSAVAFDAIRAYSPYDNVKAQDYPHILAMSGLTDPRVTYWEPTKWVARLRALNTSDNLILLRTNMGAGHGGASGRFDSLKETALEYAFACRISGLLGRH